VLVFASILSALIAFPPQETAFAALR